MAIKFNDLCKDVINYMVYNYLEPNDIHSTLLTCKSFNVLNPYQLNVIKTASNGWEYCIKNGHLEASKWLYDLYKNLNKPINYFDENNDLLFVSSCGNGHLETSKWILEIYCNTLEDNNLTNNTNLCNSIKNAIQNSYGKHLEVFKWLYSFKIVNFDEELLTRSFFHFCYEKKLGFAKWAYKTSIKQNHKINIHSGDDIVFFRSCTNGMGEICRWLYQLGLDTRQPFDVNMYNGICFTSCCILGYLDIAKWIYQLNIEKDIPMNIHANDNYLFKQVYEKEQLHVCKWIYQLSIEYNNPMLIDVPEDVKI